MYGSRRGLSRAAGAVTVPLGRANSEGKKGKPLELLRIAGGISMRRLDQLFPQNCDIAWSFDADPYLIPFQLHDRDLDVWADHD
jgi:hypothetical protein